MSLSFADASPGNVDAVLASPTDADDRGQARPWDAFRGRYAMVLDRRGNTVEPFAPVDG